MNKIDLKSLRNLHMWKIIKCWKCFLYVTEEAEGQGAGSKGSKGSNPCPEAVKRSGTWVSSPAFLGRSRLVGVQDPLLPPPCSLLPAPLPLLTDGYAVYPCFIDDCDPPRQEDLYDTNCSRSVSPSPFGRG